PPAPFSAPRTPFNVALTSQRAVAWAHLPLDAVKGVKREFGCTFNDVVLTLCSSALRTHLARVGQAPERDLVALVPVALAAPDGATTGANLLEPVLVSLATTVDDPVERLRAVAASAAAAKAREGVLGPGVVQEWAEATVPAVTSAAARVAAGVRLAERLPPACNVIVSNVAGPPFPLYLAGARVAALVPFGPLVEGVALNVTVLSHAGSLHAGVVVDRAAVPDVGALAGLLPPALAELESAGRGEARC
ncbi:MAG: WS/DGAT domain-containing protein, partial [Actinomycetota bacterium]|nr:WS/DGAT domain-containing protein [Actinomycetota bacterium]